MMKIVNVNKSWLIVALILGLGGAILGLVSDLGDSCRDSSEQFLKNSPQVVAKTGLIKSVSLRRRLSVDATTKEAAFVSYDFLVRGEHATALVVLKGEPGSCKFGIESIEPAS
jgi:hypothetical protein